MNRLKNTGLVLCGLNAEYESLNEEAKKLETQISLNLRGLFKNE